MLDFFESAVSGITSGSSFPGGSNSSDGVRSILFIVANIAVVIAVATSMAGMAVAFVMYITSMGNPKAVEKARTALTWSVIGFLVGGAAFVAGRIILRYMGATTNF